MYVVFSNVISVSCRVSFYWFDGGSDQFLLTCFWELIGSVHDFRAAVLLQRIHPL